MRKHQSILKKTLKKRYKGRGITQSRPIKVTQFPPLPMSPNRPTIKTNNKNLEPVSGKEKGKRLAPLAKRILKIRQNNPKINENGYMKSFFSINNNAGFR